MKYALAVVAVLLVIASAEVAATLGHSAAMAVMIGAGIATYFAIHRRK